MPKLKGFEIDKYSNYQDKEEKQKPHKFKNNNNNSNKFKNDKSRRPSSDK